jgi:hypothetical protein
MTQEEKQLLLKDLCARLPYGIMCRIDHDPEGEYDIGIDDERFIDDRIVSVCHENEQIFVYEDEDYPYSPEEIRPYLRPMSSMTEEEKKQYQVLTPIVEVVFEDDASKLIDWLNANHFDYRGLIKKGLALEAPEGMYNE